MTPIKALDLEIQKAKDSLKVANALERLSKNKDFKLVIEQVYLNDEVLRLSSMMAHPEYEGNNASLVRRLEAISHFGQFIHTIRMQANSLKKEIESLEEERREYDNEVTL